MHRASALTTPQLLPLLHLSAIPAMEKNYEELSKMEDDEQSEQECGFGTTAVSSEQTLNTNVHIEDNCSVTNTLTRSPQGSDPHSEHQPSAYPKRSSWASRPMSPIVILVIQFIMLIGMLSFVIWTSVAQPTVPRSVADWYLNYPQFTATVVTLIGTLLSLINTKLFSDAVRFAIRASLTSKGLSLYSLHATTSVASRSLLLDFGGQRTRWAVISVIYLFLSTIQISAWSSIITPRPVVTQNQGSFVDVDFAAQEMNNCSIPMDIIESSFQGFESGVAAVSEVATNTKQLLPYRNLIINGTSSGILPIPDLVNYSSNWTRVEVLQQGLSANVFCRTMGELDPPFGASQRAGYLFKSDFRQIILSCDNASSDYGSDPNVEDDIGVVLDTGSIVYNDFSYLFSKVCPLYSTDGTARHDFTLLMQLSLSDIKVWNMSCTIKPQLRNVNATYENNGVMTIQSTTDLPVVLPIDTSCASLIVFHIIQSHLPLTQSLRSNIVVNTLLGFVPAHTIIEQYDWSVNMAAYLRGVIEYGATIRRKTLVDPSLFPVLGVAYPSVSTKVYTQAIVWGQLPQLRLMIIIAPVAIMMATIYIALLSLCRARNLCLEHNMYFNPMNVLHIVAACSSGNLQTIPFPDYSNDIEAFCEDVDVGFSAGRVDIEEVQGFHFERD